MQARQDWTVYCTALYQHVMVLSRASSQVLQVFVCPRGDTLLKRSHPISSSQTSAVIPGYSVVLCPVKAYRNASREKWRFPRTLDNFMHSCFATIMSSQNTPITATQFAPDSTTASDPSNSAGGGRYQPSLDSPGPSASASPWRALCLLGLRLMHFVAQRCIMEL